MNVIVNADSNWGIGINGDMLVSISADLKRFKELTTGKTVIMGRNTLKSLPGGKPLKNRVNIVLTSDPSTLPEGCIGVSSVEDIISLITPDNTDSFFVMGGESLYRQLLPYCKTAYITKTLASHKADRFFPNLDELPNWKVTNTSPVMTEKSIEFVYIDYTNSSM